MKTKPKSMAAAVREIERLEGIAKGNLESAESWKTACEKARSERNKKDDHIAAHKERIVNLQRIAEQMRGFIRAHHTTTTVPTPTYAGEFVVPQETWPFMDESF